MSKDLTLPARLDYASLETIHADLKDARGQDILLDAAQVTHLGACGLQLLISAKMSWEKDGFTLSVVNPSPRFNDHLQLLGLSANDLDELGFPA